MLLGPCQRESTISMELWRRPPRSVRKQRTYPQLVSGFYRKSQRWTIVKKQMSEETKKRQKAFFCTDLVNKTKWLGKLWGCGGYNLGIQKEKSQNTK